MSGPTSAYSKWSYLTLQELHGNWLYQCAFAWSMACVELSHAYGHTCQHIPTSSNIPMSIRLVMWPGLEVSQSASASRSLSAPFGGRPKKPGHRVSLHLLIVSWMTLWPTLSKTNLWLILIWITLWIWTLKWKQRVANSSGLQPLFLLSSWL